MAAPTQEPTDERLIAAIRAGDQEAFAPLVGRHKRRILGIVARFARNDHDLDDLAQEVFLKAYQHLASYRADAPFEHWLARIAVRTCYDHLRRSRHERAAVELDSLQLSIEDNPGPQQARELLEFALARLAAEERLVITLLELEEQSVREIAALTGWSESNVKVRAFRARQKLKTILENSHER